ncbi:hypothetical protein LTR66_005466 [Elasticomyces elasticus]|nr:hypothetical protein LTR66_005466 [Elasticomyces elasticus]
MGPGFKDFSTGHFQGVGYIPDPHAQYDEDGMVDDDEQDFYGSDVTSPDAEEPSNKPTLENSEPATSSETAPQPINNAPPATPMPSEPTQDLDKIASSHRLAELRARLMANRQNTPVKDRASSKVPEEQDSAMKIEILSRTIAPARDTPTPTNAPSKALLPLMSENTNTTRKGAITISLGAPRREDGMERVRALAQASSGEMERRRNSDHAIDVLLAEGKAAAEAQSKQKEPPPQTPTGKSAEPPPDVFSGPTEPGEVIEEHEWEQEKAKSSITKRFPHIRSTDPRTNHANGDIKAGPPPTRTNNITPTRGGAERSQVEEHSRRPDHDAVQTMKQTPASLSDVQDHPDRIQRVEHDQQNPAPSATVSKNDNQERVEARQMAAPALVTASDPPSAEEYYADVEVWLELTSFHDKEYRKWYIDRYLKRRTIVRKKMELEAELARMDQEEETNGSNTLMRSQSARAASALAMPPPPLRASIMRSVESPKPMGTPDAGRAKRARSPTAETTSGKPAEKLSRIDTTGRAADKPNTGTSADPRRREEDNAQGYRIRGVIEDDAAPVSARSRPRSPEPLPLNRRISFPEGGSRRSVDDYNRGYESFRPHDNSPMRQLGSDIGRREPSPAGYGRNYDRYDPNGSHAYSPMSMRGRGQTNGRARAYQQSARGGRQYNPPKQDGPDLRVGGGQPPRRI